MKTKRFKVVFHGKRGTSQLYEGRSEAAAYKVVGDIQVVLINSCGSGKIEIVEDDESHWINYVEGSRDL